MSTETKPGAGTRVLIPGRPRKSGLSAFISPCSRPTAAGPSSWSRSGQDEQVVGDHAQSDPPLHPAWTSVSTSPQPVATPQCADAPLAAGAPAERGARRARSLLARLAREDDLPDPTGLRGAVVGARGAAAGGHSPGRRGGG